MEKDRLGRSEDDSIYVEYALQIKNWMDENGVKDFPRFKHAIGKEREYGFLYKEIRKHLINSYLKLESNFEKNEFERLHPDLRKIVEILGITTIFEEKKNKVSYLESAIEVKSWIEKSGRYRLPSQSSDDKEEIRMARILINIRKGLINPYLELKSDEQRKEYEKKYPDLKSVITIIEEIDSNNVKFYLLEEAKKIKLWIEKNENTRIPNQFSKDEEEKLLGFSLYWIRKFLANPYYIISKIDGKEYPEVEEIEQILNWIEENHSYAYLKNARDIQEWFEKNGRKKLPQKASKDREERNLANALAYIKQYLIKPYLALNDEDKKREFEMIHFEVKEIIQMPFVQEFIIKDRKKNKPTYLKNAREIKAWFERNGGIRAPRASNGDEEEQRLGRAYNAIKQGLINKYLALRNDEEKGEFIKKHPELPEVMQVVYEIDKKGKGRIKMQLINEIEKELKRIVGKHVDSNQEIRLELLKKAKDFKESMQNLGGKND